LNQEILDILNSIFDSVTEEYAKNHHLIFSNESERRRKQYGSIQGKLKSWKKKKRCIYRGCVNKSIQRSHSIQKSGPLKEIAENSVVLTPQFNHELGEVQLAENGLSEASVFPGYCETHEKLFHSFETTKDIESPDALSLQIYRSICREVVSLKHELAYLKKTCSDYQSFRDSKLIETINNKLGRDWCDRNKVSFQSLKMSNDPILTPGLSKIDDLEKTLVELEDEFLGELEQDMDGSSGIDLRPIAISIDEQIPVALSGFGSFYVKDKDESKRIFIVIGVFPNVKGTTLVLYSKSKNTAYVDAYFKQLNNSFDIINMIEQWMIRGTDHWFLKPSVWDAKSDEEKSQILSEMLDFSKGLLHKLNFSIFNELRIKMIKEWESSGTTDKQQLALLCREKTKLTCLAGGKSVK